MPTPSKDVRSSDREAVVSLDEHLSREQIKFLYEHIPAGLFGTLVACLLITVLSYETIDSTHLFTWFSAVLLVSALRLLLFLRFRKSFQQAHKSWEKIFFVGVLASAALFGVSGVLFFQEHDPIAQSFLTLVLGGISAGAVTSLSFKRYMIVVYIGLVMVPLTVRYFSFSNDKNTVLGFAIITFVLFLLTNANRFYRNSVSRFRLVFETERQARQIKESDRLLHSVIESMPVGLLQLDVDSGNQFVLESSNKAASEILGMDFQGQHGLPITDVFPALRKSDFLTTIRQTKDKGISQTIQNMNYKDENIDSSFDVFVFQTTENQVGIIFADISERKKVIDALEESESRFRDLADKAPALIWMADVNNLGIWFNQTWLNYTGRSLDQELGIGWSEGVHPDDIDKSVLLCQSAFDRREQFEMEFRLRRSDGEYGWIADTGIPRFTDAGEFVGYIGYCWDITQRKLAEENLIAAKESAEVANLAKTKFLSQMSHELRTPLNAIMGFAQIIEIDRQASSETKACASEIYTAGKHLLSLIEELLDLAKIESGKMSVKVEVVELDGVLQDIKVILDPMAQKHEINVNFGESEVLGIFVLADSQRLKQILINLVSNAIKYNRKNGQVDISYVYITQDRIKITVKDSGMGLSPEKISHLFEPFNRLGAEKTSVPGTGIGLSLSQQLAQMMDAELSVESEEGVGSVFSLALNTPLQKH